MIGLLDRAGRRAVAYPLALVGIGLSFLSEWCIRLAAWLVDVDVEAA